MKPVTDKVKWLVWRQALFKVMGLAVGAQVWDQVKDQVGVQVWNQTGNQVRHQAWGQAYD